jgi:outer membrane protein assembly factor BamB
MASPLLVDGCLYVVTDRGGICKCYDAATGKLHYEERVPGATGFTSSPWTAGGKVFCLDQSGTTFVLATGPEFKLLGQNRLDDQFWSSAAVADNSLLLRGVNRLYCIAVD